jgi:hypothetical protein
MNVANCWYVPRILHDSFFTPHLPYLLHPSRIADNPPLLQSTIKTITIDRISHHRYFKTNVTALSFQHHQVLNLHPRDDVEFGGKSPGWRLGGQGFSFLPDGTLLAAYTDRSESSSSSQSPSSSSESGAAAAAASSGDGGGGAAVKGGSRLLVLPPATASSSPGQAVEYSRADGLPFDFGTPTVGQYFLVV